MPSAPLLRSIKFEMRKYFNEIYRLLNAIDARLDQAETRLSGRIEASLENPGRRTLVKLGQLEARLECILSGQLDNQVLRHLYCLTPAEIRITVAMFQGKSVEAYAKEAGLTINTARWHMKQVHAKLDVHNQAELTQKLLQCQPSN
ncbi:MAG: hypothetical protein C5B60_05370 [Chloroflexi bacterium]|nr:MAG: hypothetical protein C5B60_05370 [Chloroflexota bacterium]